MTGPHSEPPPSEGYVRFQVRWSEAPPPRHSCLDDLDALRTRLWDRGWVGATPEGIGFGNLSVRDRGDTFIITGTATGAVRILGARGYTRVTNVWRSQNTVACEGPVRASAETMSHAAIYEASQHTACVIHIHAADLWRHGMRLGWPSTPVAAEYGTPELAQAIAAKVRALGHPRGILVLAGHQDGLMSYGPDLLSAEDELRTAARPRPGA